MRAACWLGLVTLVACSNDLERQSQIERVRVLAIRADPPELIQPDDGGRPAPVRLTALAVSPVAASPNVRLALCRAGNPYSADFDCPGKDGLDLDGGVVDLSQPAQWAVFLDAGGVTVGYLATDGESGERGQERGVRSMPFRTSGVPNQNPAVLDVLLDGGGSIDGAVLAPDADVTLTPELAGGSRESYSGDAGERVEDIVYTWFATGSGTLVDFRSQEPNAVGGLPDTHYQAADAGERVRLWVVARDDRGGVCWQERDFVVSR
ncbi:MAG: hypothetical protein JST54_24665 [Deltaproteobacteria bacterium]|nr:hypothetical protein [Deltaproteobacteria bacterium]